MQERATRVRERARSVGQTRAAELEAMLEVEQVQLEAQAEHAALEAAQELAKEAAQGTQAPMSTDGLDVTICARATKAASNLPRQHRRCAGTTIVNSVTWRARAPQALTIRSRPCNA